MKKMGGMPEGSDIFSLISHFVTSVNLQPIQYRFHDSSFGFLPRWYVFELCHPILL